MKLAKRLTVLVLALLIALSAAGCSLVDKDKYLQKEVLSLEDMEKLFTDEGFSLTRAEDGATSLMLQVRNATVYYIHKKSSRKLDLYVFDSLIQREAARRELDKLSSYTGTIEHQVFEAKNVLAILWAGDLANEDYTQVSKAMSKIDTD